MELYNEIVCITSSYPYGQRETYFENELDMISKEFEKVHILPLYNPYSPQKRPVPHNVTVYEPLIPQGYRRILVLINKFVFFSKFWKEFFKYRIFSNSLRFSRWLNSYVIYICGKSFFKKKNFGAKTVFYSYWAEAPFFLDKTFMNARKVLRMHGADFYVERNAGYLPLRRKIYSAVDLVVPISKDIKNSLEENYGIPPQKIVLSYLGTFNGVSKVCVDSYKENVVKIVSCSNVYPLKRVHLIFEVLSIVAKYLKVEWHHFGDGESMTALRELIGNNEKNGLMVKLYGHMSPDQIFKIYEKKYFHWFFNVSEYEGLPVSIMEAFSFGIPAIATNVGGTSEIVNEKNGLLIDKNFSPTEVSEFIVKHTFCQDYAMKRKNAFEMWNQNFNGEVNYKMLIHNLKNYDV